MPRNKLKTDVKETVAWRIRPEIKKLLEEAQRITGSNRTDLIEECVKDGIDEVIKKEVERKKLEAKRADEALRKYQQQS